MSVPPASDTVIVCVPGLLRDTIKESLFSVTMVGSGNTACGSVLLNCSVPEKFDMALPMASTAMTVRAIGVPPTAAGMSVSTLKWPLGAVTVSVADLEAAPAELDEQASV